MKKFLIIAGYGWSGSSALVDYLKEFDNTFVPDVEFRIIKDPYGISDLENALINRWDYVNSSAAIEDFLWLAGRCAYKSKGYFSPIGLGYEELLTPSFMEITQQYIDEITNFTYHNNNIHSIFKQSYWANLRTRMLDTLFRKSGGKVGREDGGNINRFSKPTSEKFISSTRNYIEQIFLDFPDDKLIVLDQAISPLHIDTLKYFGDVKMIIMDRNPADIYVDLVRCKRLVGKELAVSHDPKIYVEWHKAIRPTGEEAKNTEQVLHIGFEDFVLNYNEASERIKAFIGYDLGNQEQFKYFDPSVSKKNIGFGVCDACSEQEYNYLIEHLPY